MKINHFKVFQLLGIVLGIAALPAHAQTTAFTYQGALKDSGSNAGGTYDLRFTIYNAVSGGSAVGGPITNAPVSITNGLFTVLLDFGAGVFTGAARWLELAVRTNGSAGGYTVLNPRQALTAAPYALYATNAGVAASASGVAPGSVAAAGIASGQVVKSLNGLHDAVSLVQGANVTLSTNGSNLTINSSGSGAFSLNGTSAYFTNGNVGIGTTSPQELFNVNGAMRWGGTTTNYVYSSEDASGLFLEQRGSSIASSSIRFQSSKSSDSINYSQFHIDPNNGCSFTSLGTGNANVGIGTANPGTTLDVQNPNGTVHIREKAYGIGSALLSLDRASASLAYASQIGFFSAGNSDFAIGTSQGSAGASDFSIYDYGTANNALTIVKASGNIGIGTTSPGYKLEVAGVSYNNGLAVTGPSSPGLTLKSSSGKDWEIFSSGTGVSMAPGGLAFFNNTDDAYRMVIDAVGNVGIGTYIPQSKLDVLGEVRMCVCTITGGCDLSEPFHLSSEEIPKGSVVIIDEENPGQLRLSASAYDTRVAGIVSGANGIKPGISLSQQGINDGGENVALSGRVYALADASLTPIKPGDLLTSSSTPGHCMKATDSAKAQGAIIGKAMSSLKGGKGMVLVLVSLQ